MEQNLVTVVVPVYNVEKYLDRCVESIVNQTYRNLEIILVDDGSPDRCPEMCDEWAKRDNRIRVVHKENQGLGMARNTGIENAHGKYICFFDSDDYVENSIIEKAYVLSEKQKADITIFGFADVDVEGNVTEFTPQSEHTGFEGEEITTDFLPDLIYGRGEDLTCSHLLFSACVCMYSMPLIRRTKWAFVSERSIISEDSYSLLVLYKDVKKVAILKKVGYFYCHNPSSLTRTFRGDRYKKICSFYDDTLELVERLYRSEVICDRIRQLYFGFTISCMKQIVLSYESRQKKFNAVKDIVYDRTLQDVLDKPISFKGDLKWNTLSFFIKKRSTLFVYVLVWLQAISNK